MKIIKSEKRLCTCCMKEHEVKTVLVQEFATFKNVKVNYEASYLYCDMAEELYMDEHQMQENDLYLKDAYRKREGLLTSSEICDIRAKYEISQSDLCTLLGWGGKTITRYEGHQVQDRAHNTILKKIDKDAEWFLSLLEDAKEYLTAGSYQKYRNVATELYAKNQEIYLRKAIEATYAQFHANPLLQGNTQLSLEKVVDVIRYFAASEQVTNLYQTKLMKLMWYADALSYKKRGAAITGLAYQAMPMGAVPVAYHLLMDLNGVPCEEINNIEETEEGCFSLKEEVSYIVLSDEDKIVLDVVIGKFGKMPKKQIVSSMCREQAYVRTAPKDMILFKYAEYLQI